MALEASRTLASKTRLRGGVSLETVESATSKQADVIRQRMEASRSHTARLKDTAEKLQDAIKRGDIDQVKILNADFKSASADYETNTKDLAQVMMGLGTQFKDIGIALEEVQQRSAEEQKLVDDANALVAKMQGRLDAANLELAQAEQKTQLFGTRQRAVDAANQAIATATDQLADAKVGVTTSEQLADQRMRDRLQNMNLDQSLQRLQSITTQIVEIAKGRIDEITVNLEAIEGGRISTVEDLKRFSVEIEDGDKAIADIRAEITNLVGQQAEHTENSSSWTELQGQIKEKQNELATVEADRNRAFSLSQDGQRFLEMYSVQEQSQRSLLQFHQIWIATLETGVEQRSVLYESHLGVIRAAGDQKAMGMVDAVAVETDERITTDAAQHLGAIQNQMLDKLKSMPEQVRRMREITEANAKGKAAFDEGMAKLFDEFRHNWGTPQGYDDSSTYAPSSETASSSSAT